MRSKPAIGLCLVGIWLGALSGCFADRPIQPPKGETAKQLYKEGVSYINDKNYRQAIESFYQLKYDYPAEAAAMLADLKIADAYFADKQYENAIESYEDFRRMHPASPYVPYAVYMLGLTHYKRMLSIDRDQTNTERALNEFQYLITHFPKTPYVWDAQKKAQECMERLSAHEVYVGRFYYRQKKYAAAISRFEAAIAKYPSVPLEDKTLFALARSYRRTEQLQKAVRACTALIQQYPESKYAKKARRLLEEVREAAQPSMPAPQSGARQESRAPRSTSVGSKAGEGAAWLETAPRWRPAVYPVSGVSGLAPASYIRIGAARSPSADDLSRGGYGRSAHSGLGAAGDGGQGNVASMDWTRQSGRPRRKLVSQQSEQRAPEGAREPVAVGQEKGRVEPRPQTPSASGSAGQLETTLGFGTLKEDSPINITADRMDAFQRENRVVFEGNVIVRQEDITIYAQRITAEMAPKEEGGGIRRVVAVRDVRITQKDGVATCDRAEFDNVSRTIVLSGAPKIWQGKDRIEGEKVVVHLNQEKMTIMGSGDKRVSAVLYPKSEKGRTPSPKAPESSRPSLIAPLAPAGRKGSIRPPKAPRFSQIPPTPLGRQKNPDPGGF